MLPEVFSVNAWVRSVADRLPPMAGRPGGALVCAHSAQP